MSGRSRPRDERGWRIPREGSLSRRIYDAIVIDGVTSSGRIAIALGVQPTMVRVLRHRLQRPEHANEKQKYHSRNCR